MYFTTMRKKRQERRRHGLQETGEQKYRTVKENTRRIEKEDLGFQL